MLKSIVEHLARIPSTILSLFLAQFSATFIVTSIISMLSTKDQLLLWENLVKRNLIKPRYLSVRTITYGLFALLFVSGALLAAAYYLFVVVVFIICTVLLIILTVKTLRIFYDPQGIEDTLCKDYRKKSEEEKIAALEDLYDNTCRQITQNDSTAIMTNIRFIVSKIPEASGNEKSEQINTLIGIMQVLSRDEVLFFRVYNKVGREVEGCLRDDETAYNAWIKTVSVVADRAEENGNAYIKEKLPLLCDIVKFTGYSPEKQLNTVKKIIKMGEDRTEKIMDTAIELLDASTIYEMGKALSESSCYDAEMTGYLDEDEYQEYISLEPIGRFLKQLSDSVGECQPSISLLNEYMYSMFKDKTTESDILIADETWRSLDKALHDREDIFGNKMNQLMQCICDQGIPDDDQEDTERYVPCLSLIFCILKKYMFEQQLLGFDPRIHRLFKKMKDITHNSQLGADGRVRKRAPSTSFGIEYERYSVSKPRITSWVADSLQSAEIRQS